MSTRRSPVLRLPLTLVLVALLAMVSMTRSVMAQSGDRPVPIAGDPEVLAAERLFTAWIEGQIAYRALPGVVVGVVAGDELVWSKGFGHADLASRRPMTPQTRFRMASHSKLFTATAIMQLRESGKVRLDDPVAQHLPWFRMTAAGDDDGPITVEQSRATSGTADRTRVTPRRRCCNWTAASASSC